MYHPLSQSDISLLLRLVVAHVVADFFLQQDSKMEQWPGNTWRSCWLYLHGICAGALAYTLAGIWNALWLPFVIFIAHVLRDALKPQGEDTARFFALDHLGHGIIILGCWILLIPGTLSDIVLFLFTFTSSVRFWTVILAYTLVIWPAGALIGKITKPWRSEITKETPFQGMEKAGLWIGRLERVLILTFILLNHFEAIGFLIAAKSILRFGETRTLKGRKEAEYILIGTMISFVISIILGIFTSWMLHYPLVMDQGNSDNVGQGNLFEI